MAKAWPWGHLLGNCFSFSTRLLQSECRKSESSPAQPAVLTLQTGSCKLVWWSALCCLWPLWCDSLGSLTSPPLAPRCLCQAAVLCFCQNLEGKRRLHHCASWQHQEAATETPTEQDITKCLFTMYTITLIHLEPADRTASRHQDFGDPAEDFDREGHSIFPDMWHKGFATLAWTESTVLQHFPGRPCPDKSLSGNGNYGGN